MIEFNSNFHKDIKVEDVQKEKFIYIETFSLLHMNTICYYLNKNDIEHTEIEKLDAYDEMYSDSFHGFILKHFCISFYIKVKLNNINIVKNVSILKNLLYKRLVTKQLNK